MDRCESQGASVEKQKSLAARARLSQHETRHSRLDPIRPGKLGSYKGRNERAGQFTLKATHHARLPRSVGRTIRPQICRSPARLGE